MKKIFALLLAAIMMVSCFSAALADEVLELVTDGSDETNSFTESWVGEYKLVGYYVGEEYADDNDIETVGIVELDSDITLTVEANLDASATGSDAGVMVDQAAYFHAHVFDIDAVLVVDGEETAIKCPWDGWTFNVPGEGVCNYETSVGKLSKFVKGEMFMEITGEENEAFEEGMKYIAITTEGQLIIAYSDSNLVKKGNDAEIGYALIFDLIVEE